MKTLLILAILVCSVAVLSAAPTFTIEDVGVSIRFPDDWKHDDTDTFGYVLRPSNEDKKKIRIHLTEHKDISPEEALQRSADKIKKIREERKHPPEYVLSSTSVTTTSGIKGKKAVVGQNGIDGHSYLDRYYFQKPDSRIFCVCVYHFGDFAFSKQAEKDIIESLTLTK